MNLKVFFIKERNKIRAEKLSINFEEHKEIQEYDYIDDFHCFKITNDHSITDKGIEKEDHEFVNGTVFFEDNNAKRMVSLGFLFINTNNGNVYAYNFAKKKIKQFLLRFFVLRDIDTKVDINKLQSITKIEVVLRNDPQLSLLYDNIPPDNINLISELGLQDRAVEKFTAKYEFKKSGISFAKKNLSKVISRYENLSIEGMDSNKNIIKIRDGVQLEIKIEVLFSTFEELNAILFSTIIDKIIEKERGALRDY